MDELRIVDLLYRWKISEAVKRLDKRLENEFYVTDLIYCPLKHRYQKLYKELAISSSIIPTAILGEFTHYGVEKILIDIFGTDKVKIEVECEKDINVDGVVYNVKGRIDAVVGDYIIEIKTARSDVSIPISHHILQTRIYMWLMGYQKALLLYVTASRIAEYIIDKPASDVEVAELIRSTLSGVPAPRYPWECRYCIYSMLCPSKKYTE